MTGAYQQGDVRLREQLAYACGDAGFNLLWTLYDSFLLFYLFETARVPSVALPYIVVCGRGADLAAGTLFGFFGNRLRTRWGTYRPYLACSMVPMCAAFVLLFAIPSGQQMAPLAIVLTCVAVTVFASFYTIANTAYTALLSVVSADEAVRVRMASLRFGFAAGAALLVQTFALPLAKYFGDLAPNGGWPWLAALSAVAATVLLATTSAATRERTAVPVTPAPHVRRVATDIVKEGGLPWLIAAMVLCLAALSCRGAASPFYLARLSGDAAWTGLALAVMSLAALVACVAGPLLLPRRWQLPLPFACVSAAMGAALSLAPVLMSHASRTEWLILQAAFGAATGLLLPTLFALMAVPPKLHRSSLTPALLAAIALLALKLGSAIGMLLVSTVGQDGGLRAYKVGPTAALFSWVPAGIFALTALCLVGAALGRPRARHPTV